MPSKREKEITKVANYIINNITMSQAINILIEKCKETAEVIVDNKEDPDNFESILNEVALEDKVTMPKRKRRGIFQRALEKIFPSMKKKSPPPTVFHDHSSKDEKKRSGFQTRNKNL